MGKNLVKGGVEQMQQTLAKLKTATQVIDRKTKINEAMKDAKGDIT